MIIVTGGAGFIGANLVAELNRQGITDILIVDNLLQGAKFRNLRPLFFTDYLDKRALRQRLDDGSLERYFSKENGITAILHQGACSDTTASNGRYLMENNFADSRRWLHFALERRIPLIYASSASVYGNGQCFDEDPGNTHPLNLYAYTKKLFDDYARRHWSQAAASVVGLRFFNVYGPGEHHKGRMASMAYQCYRQLRSNRRIRLFEGSGGYGDGKQLRDFVQVGDVVRVIRHFLTAPTPIHGIFNVGTGQGRSFNDLANRLIARLGHGFIEYQPIPASLQPKYQSFTQADLTRLRREGGYPHPFLSLEDGIDQALPFWEQEAVEELSD